MDAERTTGVGVCLFRDQQTRDENEEDTRRRNLQGYKLWTRSKAGVHWTIVAFIRQEVIARRSFGETTLFLLRRNHDGIQDFLAPRAFFRPCCHIFFNRVRRGVDGAGGGSGFGWLLERR